MMVGLPFDLVDVAVLLCGFFFFCCVLLVGVIVLMLVLCDIGIV